MNRRVWIALAVAAALLGGAVAFQAVTTSPPAPDFTLEDTGFEAGMERGVQPFTLSDHRGKTVVLDFMAYNCATCRIVTPRVLEPLEEEFGARDDFLLVSVDVGEFSNFPGSTQENLVKWQTEHDSPWIHVLDTKGVFLDYLELGALGVPALFVVDGGGRIVYRETGLADLDDLRQAVHASLAGTAKAIQIQTIGIVGLAFVAGIASFVAPCSAALMPAYLGFLLKGNKGALRAGLATTAGIVALYAVLAVAMWLARDALAPLVPWFGPIVGAILVLVGGLMLAGFDWGGLTRRFGSTDGRRGYLFFGIGYGLAAFACTGPILFPLLLAGFLQGPAIAFGAFLAYAVAVASLVLAAAFLVQYGRTALLQRLLVKSVWVNRASAILLLAAGAYLIWFEWSASLA